MKVSEIKNLMPQADVYELNLESKYLIVVDYRTVSESTIDGILDILKRQGILATILVVGGNPEVLRIFSL
jgi:hypothetical protein